MRHTIIFVLAFFVGAPAALAADGSVSVVTVAEREVPAVDENGQETTQLAPVTTVVPGDEVIYTITYTNDSDQPADRVVITDPVPAQMSYVQGTAFGPGTHIRFSVDGGESWGAPEALFVKTADGNRRLADAADYTHIRWEMRSTLKPGGRGFARFRAELR